MTLIRNNEKPYLHILRYLFEQGDEDDPDSPYIYNYNLPNIEVDFLAHTSLDPTYAAFVDLID